MSNKFQLARRTLCVIIHAIHVTNKLCYLNGGNRIKFVKNGSDTKWCGIIPLNATLCKSIVTNLISFPGLLFCKYSKLPILKPN